MDVYCGNARPRSRGNNEQQATSVTAAGATSEINQCVSWQYSRYTTWLDSRMFLVLALITYCGDVCKNGEIRSTHPVSSMTNWGRTHNRRQCTLHIYIHYNMQHTTYTFAIMQIVDLNLSDTASCSSMDSPHGQYSRTVLWYNTSRGGSTLMKQARLFLTLGLVLSRKIINLLFCMLD